MASVGAGAVVGINVVAGCANVWRMGGTTLAVNCWIVPLQITGAAGTIVIIGVCLISAVTLVTAVHPSTSVDVSVKVCSPTGRLVTLKLAVLLFAPEGGFCTIVPGPVKVCVYTGGPMICQSTRVPRSRLALSDTFSIQFPATAQGKVKPAQLCGAPPASEGR